MKPETANTLILKLWSVEESLKAARADLAMLEHAIAAQAEDRD